MPIKLTRISKTPLLLPIKNNPWEAAAVFNCGVIYDNNKIHMIYRATDIASSGKDGPFISRLGYAVSDDGMHFKRNKSPLLTNEGEQELRGLEDPRIVKIDDIFYMMYTGYRGKKTGDYRICLTTSKDLKTWKRHGIILDEPNKDAALFPEKINGRFCMFHRRSPDIWIAYSDDLKKWTDHTKIMEPVSTSSWENFKVGISGPPIKTKEGWVLIYHGVNSDHVYSQGIALLDLKDPSKVIARQAEPILEPELQWEKEGHVPNVVFSCGQVEIGNKILVYYCGADTVISAAEIDKNDIIFS